MTGRDPECSSFISRAKKLTIYQSHQNHSQYRPEANLPKIIALLQLHCANSFLFSSFPFSLFPNTFIPFPKCFDTLYTITPIFIRPLVSLSNTPYLQRAVHRRFCHVFPFNLSIGVFILGSGEKYFVFLLPGCLRTLYRGDRGHFVLCFFFAYIASSHHPFRLSPRLHSSFRTR